MRRRNRSASRFRTQRRRTRRSTDTEEMTTQQRTQETSGEPPEQEESELRKNLWRPEPNWRRNMIIFDDPREELMKPKPYGERRRGGATRRSRRAEYDPTIIRPEPPAGRRLLGIGFNFPRRMQFDLWEAREADALDPDTLLHLADEFWRGYRRKRWTYMPERSDRMNLPLDRYAQVFRRDLDLDDQEVGTLIRFMVATKLLPEFEAQMVADNFQLGYSYVWDRLDR